MILAAGSPLYYLMEIRRAIIKLDALLTLVHKGHIQFRNG